MKLRRKRRGTAILGLDPLAPKEKIVDTALTPDDDDPMFTDDGYTAMTSQFGPDQMLEALEDPDPTEPQAELSPQEAYELMTYEQPESKEELEILRETPFLGPELSWIDDTDHTQWILEKMRDKRKAMDYVLEDQMYGDADVGSLLGIYEDDEAGDDELGFGIPGALKKVAKVATRAVKPVARVVATAHTAPLKLAAKAAKPVARAVITAHTAPLKLAAKVAKPAARLAVAAHVAPLKLAARAAKPVTKAVVTAHTAPLKLAAHAVTPAAKFAAHAAAPAAKFATAAATAPVSLAAKAASSVVKAFDPNRDAAKAQLVKSTYARLVAGRANYLQMADIKTGRRDIPRSTYEAQAKPWAKGKLQAGGLPTSYSAGEIASAILGEDVMGSWWNPLSWFQTKTKYVVQNAAGEIAEMTPAEFQAWTASQAAQANATVAPPPQGAVTEAYYPAGPGTGPTESDETPPEEPPPDEAPPEEPPPETYDQPPPEAYDQPPDEQQGDAMSTEDENIIQGDDPEYDLVVGEEAFSDFAGTVLGKGGKGGRHHHHKRKPKKVISAGEYRRLTLRSAQTSSGNEAPSLSALVGAHRRLAKKLPRHGIAVKRPADVTGIDPWLYKLNPVYWTKTSRERALIDSEKKNWARNRDLAKRTKKQASELAAGQRALYQAEQARTAEAESQAMESQLADIEQSIASGDVTALGNDVLGAIIAGRRVAKRNKAECAALASKAEGGKQLSPEELEKLRRCKKRNHHLRQTAAVAKASTSGYQDPKPIKDDFLGENPTEILGENPTEILGAAPAKATPQQMIALTAIATANPKGLPAFLKAQKLKLTAKDLGTLKQAVAATKAIMAHPEYGKIKMAGDGTMGADSMGFSWKSLVTAPVALAALPASATAWALRKSKIPGGAAIAKTIEIPTNLVKNIANRGGSAVQAFVHPGQLNSQPASAVPASTYVPGVGPIAVTTSALTPAALAARNARIQAARQRELAANARIRAAQTQAAAAQAEYAAAARAAQAEAEAQDAEATAQDMQAAAQDPTMYDDAYADEAGGNADMLGDNFILGTDYFSGAFVGEVDDDKAKKIVEEAQKNTPTGKKIRAGATLYVKAKKGHTKSRLAIAKMEKKAKEGDQQAQRDVNAVRAGKIAVHAKGRAATKIARKARGEANAKKVVSAQRHLEAGIANRLAQGTRRRKLQKIAKVEHAAAHGHPKAKAAVAKVVAKAQAGDPKAKTTVRALQLAKHVRTAAKTPAEARRLKAAGTVVRKARRGNKTAIRQIALIDAAAKSGQPNAKRAKARLLTAGRVERAVATGKIGKLPSKSAHIDATRKKYQFLSKRVASGVATREEAVGAARAASALGMKAEAAALAMRARELRPAAQPIRDAATVQAAAEKGDQHAQQIISDTIALANAGEPKGIAGAGKLAAVRAVADVQAGRPMPAPVAVATGLVERAHAGDPEAKKIVAQTGELAQKGDSKAIEAAVALTAASAVLAATAAKAGANEHWKTAARKARGEHIETAEQGKAEGELAELMAKLNSGEGTHRDGLRARQLAMGLGKPNVAAQISAIMPPEEDNEAPLSSLPEQPLPQITSGKQFLIEALRAITLSTGNPFENYRQGVRTRGEKPLIGPVSKS